MSEQKFNGSVDDILEGLHTEGAAPASDAAVEDILAGLGFGGEAPRPVKNEKSGPQSAAKRPVAAPREAGPVAGVSRSRRIKRQEGAVPAGTAREEAAVRENAPPQLAQAPVRQAAEPVKLQPPAQPAAKAAESQPPRQAALADQIRQRFEDAAPAVQMPAYTHDEDDTFQLDDEFTRFFTESVAVVPNEEEEARPSLFERFIRRRKEREYPDAAENTSVLMPGLSRPERQEQGDTGEVSLMEAATRQIPESDEYDEDDDTRQIDLPLLGDGPLPEEVEQAPKTPLRERLPRLFGQQEPPDAEGEGPFREAQPEPALEDYDAPEDAPAVQVGLETTSAGMSLRAVLTGILAAALLYLGLAARYTALPMVEAISPAAAPGAFLAVNLILLLVAAVVSYHTLVAGVLGLWREPTPDTLPMLAVLAAAVQAVACLAAGEGYDPAAVTLFAGPAVLALCLNAVGKRMMSGVVQRNFEAMTSGVDHDAAYLVHNQKLTARVAEGLGEPDPALLISRPTGLMKGFLRQSYSLRASDRMAQKLAWALGGAALVALVVGAVVGKGALVALSAFAGALCLGAPLCATLVSAVPSLMMQKSASRVGAVIPGWSAVEELGQANMVMVGARDLFPPSSVRLHGIKTFEKERIDLAILYAASVLVEGCDTLRDVFLAIIENKTEMLYPVENLNNEVGLGFTAWVDNCRVLVGNRQLMQKHDIDIPSRDYESRYAKGGRQLIYLAVSGKLFGMFLVSYGPDRAAARVLEGLRRSGISVLVKSDDFTLDSALVSEVYGMEQGCIKVLSADELAALAPATAYRQASEGCMAHIGSFASFVGGMQAAAGAAAGERAASLVQAVAVGFSCALSVLLAFTGGLAGLALPALVLYQAAWGVLSLALPLLRKY